MCVWVGVDGSIHDCSCLLEFTTKEQQNKEHQTGLSVCRVYRIRRYGRVNVYAGNHVFGMGVNNVRIKRTQASAECNYSCRVAPPIASSHLFGLSVHCLN